MVVCNSIILKSIETGFLKITMASKDVFKRNFKEFNVLFDELFQ